jgi:hypothetical protein
MKKFIFQSFYFVLVIRMSFNYTIKKKLIFKLNDNTNYYLICYKKKFRKIWLAFQFFKKRGIKTPPVKMIMGNLFELKNERVYNLIDLFALKSIEI